MITLLRLLALAVGVLLFGALAAAGLAVAVAAAVPGGLRELSDLADVPQARDEVGALLARLQAGGPVAASTALAAAGAAVAGLLVAAGALAGPRRPFALRRGASDGEDRALRLAVRPRALQAALRARGRRIRGPVDVTVRARRRRLLPGAGTVLVTVRHEPGEERRAQLAEVRAALGPLTAPFALRLRVRGRSPRRARRVR